eukprot:COSAG02_NODE_2902_length_7777_cov_3.802292_11_plen_92_part_00
MTVDRLSTTVLDWSDGVRWSVAVGHLSDQKWKVVFTVRSPALLCSAEENCCTHDACTTAVSSLATQLVWIYFLTCRLAALMENHPHCCQHR